MERPHEEDLKDLNQTDREFLSELPDPNEFLNEPDESDQFNSDSEADADALKSIGWGTDEDYEHNDVW